MQTTNPRLFKLTHARAHARGLCSTCYQRVIDTEGPDALIDYERNRLTHEDIMDEYEILGPLGEGFEMSMIADRLGIHLDTLKRHLAKETGNA